MRAVNLQSLKKQFDASAIALRIIIISAIVLVVAIVVLIMPWYQVTTSQIVPQTQSYTTQFEVPTTNYQIVTVYTLPSPVELHSANYGPPSPPCATSFFYCNSNAFWHSENFSLQTGVIYTVTVNECPECSLWFEGIAPSGSTPPLTGPQFNINVSVDGSGEESFAAPASAMYQVVVGYGGSYNTTAMLHAISIIGSVPQDVTLTQTLTAYSTRSVTTYAQTTVSPYTTVGVTASATVLVMLVLMVVLSIFFERQKRQPT